MYSITQHIDYSNHMKDYIKKTEAKAIIENLKTQLSNRPINDHPDYQALVKMLDGRKQRELSNLELEMRKKTRTDIKAHPDYPALIKTYEDKIQQLTAQLNTKPPSTGTRGVTFQNIDDAPHASNYFKLEKNMTMII